MAKRIAETAKIYPNVQIGDDVVIEDFCIIGCPAIGKDVEDYPRLKIGRGAKIRSHTVIYAGNQIGDNFQTGNKANIRENNKIGNDVSVGTLSIVEHSTEIGNGVRIHSQAFVPEFSRLEDNVWIGPNVVLTNAKYPKTASTKDSLLGPTVREGAKVGANSTLLPGIEVGRGSLIGAGSVVTKNVPNGAVVIGNPAIEKKKITDISEYEV